MVERARRWPLLALGGLCLTVAPLLPWFFARSTSSEAWTGLLLIATGVVLAARGGPGPDRPLWSTVALAAAGAAAVGLGVVTGVRLVQAAGVVALGGAVFSTWSPGRSPPWAALLLVGLGLPLAGDIDVLGFPLRRLSAELAALALPVLGVPVSFAETVLVTEHGLADVEAPCAGLSTLRLLLASVAAIAALRGARPPALAGALGVAVVVAIVGNATRVTLLAFLVLGARQPDLAALLHVPLGVLVFLAAAAAAAPLVARPAHVVADGTAPAVSAGPAVASLAVVAGVAGLWGGPATMTTSPPVASAPVDAVGALPLSEAEAGLYERHALRATKRSLGDDGLPGQGEVLFVATRGLRAIHAPERCLAGNGHVVVDSDVVIRAGRPVKRLVLDGGRSIGLSFLRSARGHEATDLTDVVLARLGLHGGERDDGPWVFVSLVVAADGLRVDDEHVLVARVMDDAVAFLQGVSP